MRDMKNACEMIFESNLKSIGGDNFLMWQGWRVGLQLDVETTG